MSNLYLAHHGIKGQKWGVRRYEDANGHLTPAGKKRYDKYDDAPKKKSIFGKFKQHMDERNELLRSMGTAQNNNYYKTGSLNSEEMKKIGADYDREMNSDRMRMLRAEAKAARYDYNKALEDEQYWEDQYHDKLMNRKDNHWSSYPIGEHAMMDLNGRYRAEVGDRDTNASNAYQKEYVAITNKYLDKVRKQTLKEINFKDVERGKALMDKHNMWDHYYRLHDYSDPTK